MEAGPECEGAMGLQSQLLAPRSDFRWRRRHQTFMLSRPSDYKWIIVHLSNTYSSELQSGVHFSMQIHKLKVTVVALDLNA